MLGSKSKLNLHTVDFSYSQRKTPSLTLDLDLNDYLQGAKFEFGYTSQQEETTSHRFIPAASMVDVCVND
jgi:hypothetical protein